MEDDPPKEWLMKGSTLQEVDNRSVTLMQQTSTCNRVCQDRGLPKKHLGRPEHQKDVDAYTSLQLLAPRVASRGTIQHGTIHPRIRAGLLQTRKDERVRPWVLIESGHAMWCIAIESNHRGTKHPTDSPWAPTPASTTLNQIARSHGKIDAFRRRSRGGSHGTN